MHRDTPADPRPRTMIARLATGLALVLVTACGGVTPTASPVAVAARSAAPSPTPSPTATPTPTATPSPTPSPSPSPTPSPTPWPGGALDGSLADQAKGSRLPLAVLIDDARAARPQSGFNAASVVYQAPADGYESRYMMVFQSLDARDIGPVRSGRMYFIHWAEEVHAAIAHYGGDWQSHKYLAKYNGMFFTNVDALGKGAKAFHRIRSRRAPHNGYTNTKALWAQVKRLGGPATIDPTDPRRAFIDPLPAADRPATQTIRIPYHTAVIGYRFDRKSGMYRRSVDGRAQVDPADGKRVTTRNVVVLFMSYRIDSTIEPGHARPIVGSVGGGKAWIYREGSLVKGRWEKKSDAALMRLLDDDGQEVPLVRGRTFFQVVPIGTKVTHRAG
jgi:hypothetical protein